MRYLFLLCSIIWGVNFFRFIFDNSYVPTDIDIGLAFSVTAIYFLMSYFREKHD